MISPWFTTRSKCEIYKKEKQQKGSKREVFSLSISEVLFFLKWLLSLLIPSSVKDDWRGSAVSWREDCSEAGGGPGFRGQCGSTEGSSCLLSA